MKRIASLLATLCLSQSSYAAVPDAISYQGRALTATGTLMGAGTPVNRTVTFRVWDHASNSLVTNLIYSEQQMVTIAEGEFSVLVGAGAATAGTLLGYSETAKGKPTVNISAAFAGATRYLGVTIDDGTAAVDNEISPRQQIVSGAFSLRSKVAESVDGLAITTAMLANNAVTTTQVNDAAITTSKLAVGAVTATQITDATITSAKLATGAVTSTAILDATIATTDIADSAVTSAKIADANVTTAKIPDGAITSAKILDGTITTTDISPGGINLSALVAAVQQSLVPAGTIVAYGGTVAPAGWLLCNGASVSRTTYANLFTAISTAYGSSLGTEFNIPDFRGRFLRGLDGTAARDPDRNSRTVMSTGGNTGNAIGSIQTDMFKSHSHVSRWQGFNAVQGNGSTPVLSTSHFTTDPINTNTTTGNDGGSETRPINAYVNYIIKY